MKMVQSFFPPLSLFLSLSLSFSSFPLAKPTSNMRTIDSQSSKTTTHFRSFHSPSILVFGSQEEEIASGPEFLMKTTPTFAHNISLCPTKEHNLQLSFFLFLSPCYQTLTSSKVVSFQTCENKENEFQATLSVDSRKCLFFQITIKRGSEIFRTLHIFSEHFSDTLSTFTLSSFPFSLSISVFMSSQKREK